VSLHLCVDFLEINGWNIDRRTRREFTEEKQKGRFACVSFIVILHINWMIIKVYILMWYITRNTFKTERYRHDRNDDFIFANDRRSFVSRMPQGGTLNVTKIHSDCVSVHVSKDFVYNFIHDIDVYRVDLFLIHWRSCLHSRVKDRTEPSSRWNCLAVWPEIQKKRYFFLEKR